MRMSDIIGHQPIGSTTIDAKKVSKSLVIQNEKDGKTRPLVFFLNGGLSPHIFIC